MNQFLIWAFLFFLGSVSGWVIELFFRRYYTRENAEGKWINPGFCTGPYLPIYGFGLCVLYAIASMEQLPWMEDVIWKKAALFLSMAVMMTAIEYTAGIFLLKAGNLRLWDYSQEWGNIQGIICPKFSAMWAMCGAVYYFWIHPRILNFLDWFSQNLAFSFVIGLFFGIFSVDVANSMHLVKKLRQFAVENDVIVKYERLKLQIRNAHEARSMKYHFFSPFRSDRPLSEHLKELRETFEQAKKSERAKKQAGEE